MKDLLITALNEAYTILENRTPQTKKELKQLTISDVNPLELTKFITDNNIPLDCWFGGIDNGYDGYSDICLNWEIDVPTTEKDKLKFSNDRFRSIAWKIIFDSLTNNGFKRIGVPSHLLSQYSDTTVYKMYIEKDYERLVKYYSLYFVSNI